MNATYDKDRDDLLKEIIRDYARAVSYADLVNRLVEGELRRRSHSPRRCRARSVPRYNNYSSFSDDDFDFDFLMTVGYVISILYFFFIILSSFLH